MEQKISTDPKVDWNFIDNDVAGNAFDLLPAETRIAFTADAIRPDEEPFNEWD